MKLVNYKRTDANNVLFGFIHESNIVDIYEVAKIMGVSIRPASDMITYINNLPESHKLLIKVHSFYITNNELISDSAVSSLDEVKFLPTVINPPALIDFGLTPKHLINATKTLLKYEYGPLVRTILKPILINKLKKGKEDFKYYKCNHHAVIGDSDILNWPKYTSYLDIEPELAIVVGNDKQKIAGYTILNDGSARDVQMKEMLGGAGPSTCKDFDNSKGLGPCLLTYDENINMRMLDVNVSINGQNLWKGNTSEYTVSPEEVIKYITSIYNPLPGTVIGMGTIPDCTGLDRDEWINPGDTVDITFESIGTLRQYISTDVNLKNNLHWKLRKAL